MVMHRVMMVMKLCKRNVHLNKSIINSRPGNLQVEFGEYKSLFVAMRNADSKTIADWQSKELTVYVPTSSNVAFSP